MSNAFIRKVLIIIGLLLIALTIVGGASIVIFSFKFIDGSINLSIVQYILSMIGYGVAQLLIGLLGLILIYVSIDYRSKK